MHKHRTLLTLAELCRFVSAVVVLLAWQGVALAVEPTADAAADIAALKAAGATVTENAGVVTKVQFKDCSKLSETDFSRIGRVKTLKSLTLFGKCAALNDATLPLLAGLTSLEELNTEGAQISDEGLRHLTAFTNLRSASFYHISLGMKGFTGSGFAHLKALPKFDRLTIAGTPFNDEGMAAVGQISTLRDFRTWHTYQTPAGTASLQQLPNLRSLRFGQRMRRYDGKSNTLTLDDEALGTIAKMTSLEVLYLDEARLSNAGLEKLKALPNLKDLTLERIVTSPADMEQLKKALPKVKITWKPIDPSEMEKLEKALKP
jgi:hypothetical protein